MSRTHNKKRNVGIIYEQIINFICESLLNENKDQAEKATEIIKNNFHKDSQLFKEYKLFKALATTHNISDQLATSIIGEAKKACNHMFNSDQLEREKSALIKDLNYTFGKGVIFESKINDYRIYATIQTLLNEWRESTNNFDKTTEYEIKLHESLTKKEVIQETKVIPRVDALTFKVMRELFDKKYSSTLNGMQKKLIEAFIKDEEENMSSLYTEVKENTISDLNKYITECSNNILIEKYQKVKDNLQNLDENDMSKENLERFLTVSQLREEVLGD
jgi:hypothetical protein